MTTFHSKAVAFVALTGLAACNRQDARICLAPQKIPIGEVARAKDAIEWRKIAENCVHVWAYRLASAPGSNSELARAVETACADPINEWVTWRSIGKDSEVSLYGSPEGLERAAKEEMLNLALFRVVQGRAGNCEIPESAVDYSELQSPQTKPR